MNSWGIGRKLMVSFGVIAALLLVASAVAIGVSYSSKTTQARAAQLADALRASAEVEAYMRALDGGQKLLVVAGLTGVVERTQAGSKGIDDASREMAKRIETLRTAATTDEVRRAVDGIAAGVDAWKRVNADVVALIDRAEFDAGIDKVLGEGFNHQQKVVQEADALQTVLQREYDAHGVSARRSFVISTTLSILVLAAAVLMGIAIGVLIRQTTAMLANSASELKMASQQVASASQQVASSSQSLSQGATEQAASLEETSASMEEMASMTRKNAENSQNAAQEVAETERLVKGANGALGELVKSMSGIRESSGKVTKIIKTIDEIAFQTNILALNAAVEAARAGEAGMGFAVVADEVRNLAQRSAQAAKDTAALIEESASNAASGGAKVDAVVGAMQAITTSSARVRGLVEEVSTASREQTQGIDQVTQAIAQMEKVTQTTAATAEESSAASQELSSQAGHALAVVNQLEALVHGAEHAGPAAVPPAAPAAGGQPTESTRPLKIVRSAIRPGAQPTAEDQIPFGETGTFGSF